MRKKITIIDYGLGNLKSLANALTAINAKYEITCSPEKIGKASKLILPGVGHFETGMKNIWALKLAEPIKKAVQRKVPLLGICLGLQLLFEKSEEAKGTRGLDLLEGNVVKFKTKQKIPNIGWNRVNGKLDCRLLKGLPKNAYMYFVHSYYAKPVQKKVIAGTTEYGETYCSIVEWKNMYAVQFHPEKSGNNGLKVLRNFAEL